MKIEEFRCILLAALWIHNQLKIPFDWDVLELAEKDDKKSIKWAMKKKFIIHSFSGEITVNKKGIDYLRKHRPSIFNKSLALINQYISLEDVVQ